jgi:hypothetical protein
MFAEVLLRLSRRDPETVVEGTFSPGAGDAARTAEINEEADFSLDLVALEQSVAADSTLAGYGMVLANALFPEAIRKQFNQAYGRVTPVGGGGSSEPLLRVRLRYDPHWNNVAWETLRSPIADTFLACDGNVTFTREVTSREWVSSIASNFQRSLLVICNPENIEKMGLPPIEVGKELESARAGLGALNLAPTEITDPRKTTCAEVLKALEGGYDVWYLVCHGAIEQSSSSDKPRAWLLLTKPDGRGEFLPIADLERAVAQLRVKPSLVFLLSCQGAGSGKYLGGEDRDRNVAWALAPRLARTGIPAVIAMQGQITQDTARDFAFEVLQELRKHGDVERAVSAARRGTYNRKRADWWAPALFTRAGSGGLVIKRTFREWPVIVNNIREGNCIPILGLGVGEELFGAPEAIVQRIAKKWGYPLGESDLSTVAQYIANKEGDLPKRELLRDICRQMLLATTAPDAASLSSQELSEMSVGELRKKIRDLARTARANPDDPYRILAELPFRRYISTMPDTLLEDALAEQTVVVNGKSVNKRPYSQVCNWKEPRKRMHDEQRDKDPQEDIAALYAERRGAPADDPDDIISKDIPHVFHLFGSLDEIQDWVLTEDEYFDFLSSVSNKRTAVPESVKRAIVQSSLLFVGFRINQWSFRVLLQIIQQYRRAGEKFAAGKKMHVAVQLAMSEPTESARQAAEEYITQRFDKIANIKIYWGSTQQFLVEMRREFQSLSS